MNNESDFAVKFHFDNQFTENPKDFGGITLFQFGELCCEKNYIIPPHKQWCYEISYIISGKATFLTDGVATVVTEGDIYISPFERVHEIIIDSSSPLRYAYIAFNFNDTCENDDYNLLKKFYRTDMTQLHTKDVKGVLFPFFRGLEEFYRKSVCFNMMVECYLKQILILTRRSFKEWDIPILENDESVNTVGNTVYSVIRYIDDNIFDIKFAKDVVAQFPFQYKYLTDLFKSKIGVTMQQYINCKRIEKSLDLLKYGNLPLSQIARQLNYSSVHSYSQAFLKIMNKTPNDYIKEFESNSN